MGPSEDYGPVGNRSYRYGIRLSWRETAVAIPLLISISGIIGRDIALHSYNRSKIEDLLKGQDEIKVVMTELRNRIRSLEDFRSREEVLNQHAR